MRLGLVVALALALVPLIFIDDAVNPNPLTAQPLVSSKIHSFDLKLFELKPEWVRTVVSLRLLLHANDTVLIQVFLSGCRLAGGSYTLRVRHVSTGRVYEHSGEVEGEALHPPLFVAELGGIHEILLEWDLRGEGRCECRAEVVASRGDKSGYVRAYAPAALAGLLLTGVAGYAVWKRH
ncbi:MAG: hypothetical protein QXE91_06625 [Thermofilaceae archaeon]